MSRSRKTWNVLFLCTGNSARSILAEALLNAREPSCFRAFSAGSHPTGRVHPIALEILRERGCDTHALRSKSWQEFAQPGAPELHFVFTVCDAAGGERCPVWPGMPMTAHWGLPDPAAAPPASQREAFERIRAELERRIALFTSLPVESLDRTTLQKRIDAIPGAPSDRPLE